MPAHRNSTLGHFLVAHDHHKWVFSHLGLPDLLAYRFGAGVMLLNTIGHVWIGRRLDNVDEAWQMPQGGVDEGEDSWAGALSVDHYRHHVLPHSRKVFDAVRDLGVPTIHFGVGTGELLSSMADAGPDVVGVDWRVDLGRARSRVGQRSVQGNLDPAACLAPWSVVDSEVRRVLAANAGRPGHVFNLGHGVLPETDPTVLTRVVQRLIFHSTWVSAMSP